MARQSTQPLPELLRRARGALTLSQAELGPAMGWSHRTAVRWERGLATPTPPALAKLAALLAPVDLDLAAEVAAQAGTTLEALGLVVRRAPEPPAAPPVPVEVLADAVVCAAADVTDLPPRELRAILHAALVRTRALGLTLEQLEDSLRVRIDANAPAGKPLERPRVRVAHVEGSDDAQQPPLSGGRSSRAK